MQRGSSIVEVVVMMLIMSIAMVGIYSMVNNGQKLAILTDDRLTAVNIAREGLESIGALRDTFTLRSFGSNGCFFTVDGSNYGNCPLTTTPQTFYILSDVGTLIPINTDDFSMCINEYGWYSQQKKDSTTNCTKTLTDVCGGENTTSCKTLFTRKIYFQKCSNPIDPNQCIKAKVEVRWGTDSDKTLTLEQVFTRKN